MGKTVPDSDQSVLEKVTAFITRGAGAAQELLVFRHRAAGVQLPAGTVEAGEDVEAALWREVREETRLSGLTLLAKLGKEAAVLPPDRRALLRTVPMLSEPDAASSAVGLTLRRGLWVREAATRGGWSWVRSEEYEKQGEALVVLGATTGWVPSSALAVRVVRHFFHLGAPASTPDRWRREGEPGREFALFWAPLAHNPGLVAGQAEWLARFKGRLGERG